jgi:hypothetical protein
MEVSKVHEKLAGKELFNGREAEIPGETDRPRIRAEKGQWRNKLTSRKEMLKYLQSGERYWYSDDWYGSERRKSKA